MHEKIRELIAQDGKNFIKSYNVSEIERLKTENENDKIELINKNKKNKNKKIDTLFDNHEDYMGGFALFYIMLITVCSLCSIISLIINGVKLISGTIEFENIKSDIHSAIIAFISITLTVFFVNLLAKKHAKKTEIEELIELDEKCKRKILKYKDCENLSFSDMIDLKNFHNGISVFYHSLISLSILKEVNNILSEKEIRQLLKENNDEGIKNKDLICMLKNDFIKDRHEKIYQSTISNYK